MMHEQFKGSSVQVQPRAWGQSPETFRDVPELADAHMRTLRDLVHSVQIPLEESKAQMVKTVNADTRAGMQVQYYFDILDEMGVMEFSPYEFNDQATFLQWLECSQPAFMRLGQFSPKTGKKSSSRRTAQDTMGQLSKWMKIHGVHPSATEHFDWFRTTGLWSILGRDAAPTTQARKQGELKFTDELRIAVFERLQDLLNNPNAVPLLHESKKKGQDDIIGKGRLLSINAAFFIGLNTTNRGGEITKLKVGAIDFDSMMIST